MEVDNAMSDAFQQLDLNLHWPAKRAPPEVSCHGAKDLLFDLCVASA